eukprot:101694-Chlamydomonas_euryale.AAC.2
MHGAFGVGRQWARFPATAGDPTAKRPAPQPPAPNRQCPNRRPPTASAPTASAPTASAPTASPQPLAPNRRQVDTLRGSNAKNFPERLKGVTDACGQQLHGAGRGTSEAWWRDFASVLTAGAWLVGIHALTMHKQQCIGAVWGRRCGGGGGRRAARRGGATLRVLPAPAVRIEMALWSF